MKRLALLAAVVLAAGGLIRDAGASARAVIPQHGQYIVGFRASLAGSQRSAVAAAASAHVLPSRLGAIHAVLVSADAAGARALAHNPSVRYVEPNRLLHADALPSAPNDPLFGQLWALANTGQTVNGDSGTAGDDIGAVSAWQHGTGSRSVVVADIDSGLDTAHPDLAPNLWINPGENCTGCRTDGIDNDGNGYVDDWRGWDFVQNDNVTNDPAKHGTHTAGTIGAAGDNSIGVIGVAPVVSLMPLRFLGSDGVGTTAAAVEAMLYAVHNGARVINGSWGGGGYSQAMVDAIAQADAQGVLYVASAGNSATGEAFYPAAIDLPNVISTAATDQNDQLAWFSTFGDTVDLAAPGVDVLSTWPGGGYRYADGTSMAAPQVAGAAALLFSQHPAATPETIKSLLFSTVKQLPSLHGKVLTGGRLDLAAAAGCQPAPDVWIDAPRPGFVTAPGHPVAVRILAGECAAPAGVTVSADVDGSPLTLTTAGNGLYTGSFMPATTGPLTVHAQAGDGTVTATRTSGGRVAAELAVDGQPHQIAAAAGDDALVAFTATAGQRVAIDLGSGLGATVVNVTAPDGTRLLEDWPIAAGGGFIDPLEVPFDGVYWVRLHPTGGGGGTLPVTLFDVPADVTATTAADGVTRSVTLPVPGQRATLTMPGTAGSRISMRITSDTVAHTRLQVKQPNGKSLLSRADVTTAGVFVDVKPLPATGSYRVVLDPIGDAAGGLALTIWTVPADITGGLVIGGSAVTVSPSTPGQNVRLSMAGSAGKHVTLHLSADTIAGADVSILRPDGSVLAGPKRINLAGGTLAATLPVNGTYTAVVDPLTYRTGKVTVTASSP